MRRRRFTIHPLVRSGPARRLSPAARLLPAAALLLAAALVPVPALQGQDRIPGADLPLLSLQLRAGIALPAGGFLDVPADWDGEDGADVSYGIGLSLARGRTVNPYVGIGQHRMRCSADRCGGERELVWSGFDLGTRIFPFGHRGWMPWVRAGAVRYALEAEGPAAGSEERSGGAWGVEAGAGVEIRIVGDLLLSPAVRWIRLDHELPSGEVRLRGLVADVGLVVGF